MKKHDSYIPLIILTLLLAACSPTAPHPTPISTPLPAPTAVDPVDDGGASQQISPYTPYYNGEGNFSLALPSGWTSSPAQSSPLGSKVLLGPEPLDDTSSAVIVADAAKVSNEQAVKGLCKNCDPLPALKGASLNGLNASTVEISTSDNAPRVEWWLVEKDGKRIIFSLYSPETSSPLSGVIQSFTFGKEVGNDPKYGPAAWSAQQTFAAEEGLDPYQVIVASIQPIQWPDACLEAADEGEVCAQEVTLGYTGILKFSEIQAEFHTNQIGSQIRLIPGAALALRQVAAQQNNLDIKQIKILRAEKTDWPDACLSLPGKDEICAQVVSPGYRIILLVNGKKIEYHTDLPGQAYRPVQEP